MLCIGIVNEAMDAKQATLHIIQMASHHRHLVLNKTPECASTERVSSFQYVGKMHFIHCSIRQQLQVLNKSDWFTGLMTLRAFFGDGGEESSERRRADFVRDRE